MVEIQTIITRQNRNRLRRPDDDLSRLACLNAVLKSHNLFTSQSSTPAGIFKYGAILKLKYTTED
jgi:hypothetical protein